MRSKTVLMVPADWDVAGRLGAIGGNGFAQRNLEKLRAMLSPAEIAEGEARAKMPLEGSK